MPGSTPPDRPDPPDRGAGPRPDPEGGRRAGRPPRRDHDRPEGGTGRRTGPRDRGAAGDGRKTLPPWLVPAVGGGIVALVLAVVLLGRGGGSSDAGPCLSDLLEHLPGEATLAYGTDLVQARDAGYDDDAPLEDLGETLRSTGVIPDPLSQQFRFQELATVEQLTSRTGIELDDLACSLATPTDGAVMAGEFRVDQVRGSELGADGLLAATGDRLALGTGDVDAADLVDPLGDRSLAAVEPVGQVLAALRDGGAYSVVIQVGDDDGDAGAGGIGVGGSGDDRTMVVAYAFADADAATANLAAVVDRVNEAARGTASISNDDLEVDGSVVQAVIPTREPLPLLQILATDRSLVF